MSLILAIESGTEVCSVAIVKDGCEVLAQRESSAGRDHARLIASFADEMLRELGIKATELSAVAVSQGPGSYTGLRVGVSFAKGLCYGVKIPMIGVDSLAALCRGAVAQLAQGDERVLLPMIDARRMEVYSQPYDSAGAALGEVAAVVVDEESFAQWRDRGAVIFGDGAEKCRETLGWTEYLDVKPSAVWVAQVAAEREARGESEDIAYFEPFYLKEAVVTKSKKKFF